MGKSPEHAICIEGQPEKEAAEQIIIDTLEANVTVAPLYESLKNLMQAKKSEADVHIERAKEKPKIQRVPDVLIKEHNKFGKHSEPQSIGETKFEKYYEPLWISIGPIHHGKPKLMLAEKKYKPELVVKFINDSSSGIEALYKIIKDRIAELKKCFVEDVIKDYDDDTLSWMLFFDGCSTLQFISSYVKDELELFSIKHDQVAYAQRDLFLLENQIPFLVLKLLMECRNDAAELKNLVETFIRLNVMTPKNYKKKLEIKIGNDPEPTHLLELLWLAILEQPKKHRNSSGNLGQMLSCTLYKVITKFPINKLGFSVVGQEQRLPSVRSIQDLKSAGIDLKPSRSCSLRDVSFTSLSLAGRLRLPPMTVDVSTGSRFLNLIAYEMCPDNFRTNYEVTSYICFLDWLIEYPNDVKELRSAKILHNHLGPDSDVAQLLHEIAKDLVPNAKVYKNVIYEIRKHYRNKWKIWIATKCTAWTAQVFSNYCSSPWTVVALLAAGLAMAMSGIQTWYTVYPPPQSLVINT